MKLPTVYKLKMDLTRILESDKQDYAVRKQLLYVVVLLKSAFLLTLCVFLSYFRTLTLTLVTVCYCPFKIG